MSSLGPDKPVPIDRDELCSDGIFVCLNDIMVFFDMTCYVGCITLANYAQ